MLPPFISLASSLTQQLRLRAARRPQPKKTRPDSKPVLEVLEARETPAGLSLTGAHPGGDLLLLLDNGAAVTPAMRLLDSAASETTAQASSTTAQQQAPAEHHHHGPAAKHHLWKHFLHQGSNFLHEHRLFASEWAALTGHDLFIPALHKTSVPEMAQPPIKDHAREGTSLVPNYLDPVSVGPLPKKVLRLFLPLTS
jgi:hypothetical protein